MKTPLSEEEILSLRSGDFVMLSGIVFTARDVAHRRLIDLIGQGRPLPFDPKGQVIYYAGPCPTPPGKVIGSIGPTTSGRMDPFTPQLLALGIKGTIGKGKRSKEVKEALIRHKAVYFATIGGAGAILSRYVKRASIIAFEDLGPEAITELEVEDFPLVVINDAYGGDLYEGHRFQLPLDDKGDSQ